MVGPDPSTPSIGLRGVRVERRLSVSSGQAALARVAGVLAGMAVSAVILRLTGRNPVSLLWKSADGTFGERRGVEEMGLLLTPILMNALAVHVALRMRIWNIGSEGQFFMGAWAAAGIGIHWGGPRYLELLAMGAAAAAAGAAWILVPARAGALARERDHHDAAPELHRHPVGRLVQLRHLA